MLLTLDVLYVRSGRVSVGDESIKCVDEFCYLGDMVSAVGKAEASLVARVQSLEGV